MTPKKLFSSLVAVLVGVVWLVVPADALAIPGQKSALVADPNLNCDGSAVGKSLVKNLKDGTIKVKVKFKKGLGGPVDDSGIVYWTCTNVSNGCHDQACGFVSIGEVSTDSNGKGKFLTILQSNPYPGSFVHLDVIMNSGLVFDSVFPDVPLGASGGARGASGGDPAK